MTTNDVDVLIARKVAKIHTLMDDVLEVLRQPSTPETRVEANILRGKLRREMTLLASMWRERTALRGASR